MGLVVTVVFVHTKMMIIMRHQEKPKDEARFPGPLCTQIHLDLKVMALNILVALLSAISILKGANLAGFLSRA